VWKEEDSGREERRGGDWGWAEKGMVRKTKEEWAR